MNKPFTHWALAGFLFILFMVPLDLLGQGKSTTLKVVASNDQLPIIGATIQLSNLDFSGGWLTDASGTAVLPLEKPSEISISFLGFIGTKKLLIRVKQ